MTFGRLERTPGTQPMSDINMTPLIDVMLVLLVIFMITAPLMTSSLKLDLPKTDAGQPSDASQFISVALDPQGRYYIDEEAVDAAAFTARLTEAARRNPQTEVQLRADRAVPYGQVAELIGRVQQAGLSRVGFVTEPGDVGTAPSTASADAAPTGRANSSPGAAPATPAPVAAPTVPTAAPVSR